jgi:Fungal specific transcription factor domain
LDNRGILIDSPNADASPPSSRAPPAWGERPLDLGSNFPASPAIEDILGQAAFATVSAASTPKYVGAGSGLPLTRLLLLGIGADMSRPAVTNLQNGYKITSDLAFTGTLDQLLPFEQSSALMETYFEHNDYFMPILSRSQLFLQLEDLYNAPPDLSNIRGREHQFCRCFSVLATGVLLLGKSDSTVPLLLSQRLMATAMKIMWDNPAAVLTLDLDCMEVLLLFNQYVSLHPYCAGAWHILGLATRLAIDLGLHEESPSEDMPEETDRRRRLFWAAYSFELNMCTILGRPIGIPDETITTKYPIETTVTSPDGIERMSAAVWLIKQRRLEAEMHTVLYQDPPRGFPPLNYLAWRHDMARRLHDHFESHPVITSPTPLTPTTIFEGFLCNAMVRLYSPSKHIPKISAESGLTLARNSIEIIELYSKSFRDGNLRFYWRAIPNLFRAGVALLYYTLHIVPDAELSRAAVTAAVSRCSSVLWGMVERYPAGKSNRDLFDEISKRVLSTNTSGLENAVVSEPSYEDLSTDLHRVFTNDRSLDIPVVGDDGLLPGIIPLEDLQSLFDSAQTAEFRPSGSLF